MKLFVKSPTGPAWDAAKTENNWLVWQLQPKDGGGTRKVPINLASGMAQAAKVAATLTFDEALLAAKTKNGALEFGDVNSYGVGYLSRPGSALITIDLDDCIADGDLTGAAGELAEQVETYAEVSVSCTGLRLIRPRGDVGPEMISDRDLGDGTKAGLYASDSRFAAITGNPFYEDVQLNECSLDPLRAAIGSAKSKVVNVDAKTAQIQTDRIWKEHWLNTLDEDAQREAVKAMLTTLEGTPYQNERDPWRDLTYACKDLQMRVDWDVSKIWDEFCHRGSNYNAAGNESLWWERETDGSRITWRSLVDWANQAGFDRRPWVKEAKAADTAQRWADHDAAASAETFETSDCSNTTTETVPRGSVDLTRPPGLLGAFIDRAELVSNRDTRFFGLAGGLIALAVLGKHRFVVETPLHITPLNLQLLVAAPTGAGKESARDIAERAAGDSDMLFMREPASASALHDTLNDHPNCVVAIDEFGQYLQAADAAKGHDYQMTQLLMQAFTSAHKSLPARRYANSKNQKPAVPHPYINGLYTTTAIELVEGLGKTATGSGFLGRMLILWMDETPRLRELHECGYVPDDCAIQEVMKRLADWQLPEGEGFGDTRFWYGWEKRPFWKIPLTVEAHDYYARVRHYFDEQMKTDLPSVRPLWSRALETALRVAGCVALGNAAWNDRISDVMVDLATLQYAVRLVVYSIQRFAPEAEEFTAVDKFDQLQKRIIKQVKTHAGEDGWTSRTDVLNNAKGGGFSYRQASEEMEGMIDPDGYGLLRPRVDEHGKSYTPAMVKLTERALGLQPQQTRTLENTLTDFTPPEGL